jgi:hypothetical protein
MVTRIGIRGTLGASIAWSQAQLAPIQTGTDHRNAFPRERRRKRNDQNVQFCCVTSA